MLRQRWRSMLLLVGASALAGSVLAAPGAGASPSVVTPAAATRPAAPTRPAAVPPAVRMRAAALVRMPLRFEPNRGQLDRQARFVARGGGAALWLTSAGSVLSLAAPAAAPRLPAAPTAAFGTPARPARDVLRISFAGANRSVRLVGEHRLPGVSNYLLGPDRRRWQRNVPGYAAVRAIGVYPGVDVVYYGSGSRLEYDILVAPGADPTRVRMAYVGARAVAVSATGGLVVRLAHSVLRLPAPHLYAGGGAARKPVAGRFVVTGSTDGGPKVNQPVVSVAVGAYDRRSPLTIDPTLAYSTYLGGILNEDGRGIAVDATGASYITGYTQSPDFPTRTPAQPAFGGYEDAIVTKLAPDGRTIVYSTYLGGANQERGRAIALDATGAAYVTGLTASGRTFPVTSPVQASFGGGALDAFVAKLTPDGTALVYASFLGGSGADEGTGIAVDAAGAAIVTGDTRSADYPIAHAVQPTPASGAADGFITKLAPAGTALSFSTFLGGTGVETLTGVALDATGSIYVVGTTTSGNFPTVHPLQPSAGGYDDAFVAKLTANGAALDYATYLGGSYSDVGTAIAVDGSGAAYVTGTTASPDFPVASPLQGTFGGGAGDVFVAKLRPDGTGLDYSTFLGGGGVEVGFGIALDATEAAYITGYTTSGDFPTVEPLQSGFGGDFDLFLARVVPDGGALAFSTYLGGTGGDEGLAIALDSAGAAYLTGDTDSNNFPLAGPLQASAGGYYDSFAIKVMTSVPAQSTCDGLRATIIGTAGPDRLIGTPGPDVIVGLAGDDVIKGGGGADTICGGPGNDRISGGPGDDRLEGGTGNDVLFGSHGDDVLDGGPGDDRLGGGSGVDSCFGDAGVDAAAACESGGGVP